jgi:MFS family permease
MDTRNPQKRDISQSYIVVIGAFFSMLSVGAMVTSFGIFFKPLATEFGWTRGDTSGAFSTALVLSGVMSIVSGRLADIFSPRFVVISCEVLIGCACLLLSQMSTLYQLYLYFGVMVGCGMSIMIPITSLITRIYKKRRGLMTGIAISGASIGSVAIAPVITLLIDNFGWKISYIILGIFILIITVISSLLLRDPKKQSRLNHLEYSSLERGTSHGLGSTLWNAVRTGSFWTLGLILFCVAFSQMVILVHVVPHATDIGISPVLAAAILSVVQGASAIGNFIAGRTNDIIGGRLSMIMCLAVMIIGNVVLLVAGSLWALYLVAVLIGTGVGGAVTLRSTIVAELFGLRSHGAITGAVMFVSTIGGAVGPLIAGYVFDINKQYKTAFIIAMGICLMGLVTAYLLKQRFAANDGDRRI